MGEGLIAEHFAVGWTSHYGGGDKFKWFLREPVGCYYFVVNCTNHHKFLQYQKAILAPTKDF